MFLGEAGDAGDMGGLRRKFASGSAGSEAPGLKLKAGRANLDFPSSLSGERSKDLFGDSMADIGRLAVDRAKVICADGEGGCAGKTNGGLGGGTSTRGER